LIWGESSVQSRFDWTPACSCTSE